MATAPTYCTHRQLKDVFPQVDSFDNKRPIYGWVQETSLDNWGGTSNLNIWYATNTGLITGLYKDGAKFTAIPASVLTTENTQVATEQSSTATGLVVDSTSGLGAGDIVKIENEYQGIVSVTDGTTLAVTGDKNLFGTNSEVHEVDKSVYLAIDESIYDGSDHNYFLYDSALDLCIIAVPDDLNPNDFLMEAGEDFSTLITRMTANASRYLDAKLDPNLPKEQLKDKEGNYDYIIVRTTALIAATFLIRSHDPTSEVATALMEDAMGNIDALNKGGAALSWQTTGDSSKGVIREVGTISGALRPVDTRGRWAGSFDVIKVKIIDAGAIGTATYSVWTKGNDKLGANEGQQVVTAETIDGDYQILAGGLQIRFSGSAYNSEASAGDTWEIEVAGWQEEVDNSAINSVRMTRR